MEQISRAHSEERQDDFNFQEELEALLADQSLDEEIIFDEEADEVQQQSQVDLSSSQPWLLSPTLSRKRCRDESPTRVTRLASLVEWMPLTSRPKLLNQPSFGDWRQSSPPVELKPYPDDNQDLPSPMPLKGFRGAGAKESTGDDCRQGNVTSNGKATAPISADPKDPVQVRPIISNNPPIFAGVASASTSAHQHRLCQLEQLPHEVVFRVLCCLSAESLATMAQTSRHLYLFSLDNSLWCVCLSALPCSSSLLPC